MQKSRTHAITELLRQNGVRPSISRISSSRPPGCKENLFTLNATTGEVQQRKNEEDIDPAERYAIDLITLEENVMPFGSYTFKSFKYPSDIDIFEDFQKCCSINEVRLTLEAKIQTIAQRIAKTIDLSQEKQAIFGDFRAGFDDRYNVYVGEVYNGEVLDYSAKIVNDAIDNLANQGLLTKGRYQKLKALATPEISPENLLILDQQFKTLKLLHWSLDEILRGYKEVIGKRRIYLYDALISHSIVKLDIWYLIEGRYVEITNFIHVVRLDPEGKAEVLSEPVEDYYKTLLIDITKFVTKGNYLKAAKRLWSLAYLRENYELLVQIAPLFSSYISLFSAVRTDLEVMEKILRKYPKLYTRVRGTLPVIAHRLIDYKECASVDKDGFAEEILLLQGLSYTDLLKQLPVVMEELSHAYNKETYDYIKSKNIDIVTAAIKV